MYMYITAGDVRVGGRHDGTIHAGVFNGYVHKVQIRLNQ